MNSNDAPLTALLRDESATERVGQLLATVVRPRDFIGLQGELGAGKTCVTRGIVRALAPDVRVTSPTYTLLNEYEGPEPYVLIVHADLYRLSDEDDLESTGYWDAIADADLLVVEWIDRVPMARPDAGWHIRLDHADGGRRVTVNWEGEGAALRLSELRRVWGSLSR